MSFISDSKQKLEGAPNTVLTVALLAVAVVAILIALFGHPLLKAGALAWMIMP